MYRSFDRREESLIYDRMSISIADDLLRQTYLSTRRSLELANQGGARVKSLDVQQHATNALKPMADGVGFQAKCEWTVSGSVGHWGHTHRRTNQYAAVLIIEPRDGVWKITSLTITDQQRIQNPGQP